MSSQEITNPLTNELVTLNGKDHRIPILNETTGTFDYVRPATITPHADHSRIRPFRGRNPIYPISKGRVLDVMSSSYGGSSYTLNGGLGTAVRALDNNAIYGTYMVKLTTGTTGPGAYSFVRRNDIGRVLDVSNMWIGMDFDSPNPDNLYSIALFLGKSVGGVTIDNYYRWNNIIGSQAVRPIQYGKKTRITFPLAIASLGALGNADSVTNPSGTLSLSQISSWQVRIDGKVGQSAEINLDRIFFFDKPDPAICMTMDDSYRSWYDLGKPVMDELGIRSTLNLIRVYSDPTADGYTAPSNRLTEDMIRRFVEGGHEAAFHMTGNSAPEDFTPDQVHAEIIAFKKWVRNKFGQDVTTGAYPGGEQGYFKGPLYPPGTPLAGQPKPGWKDGDELKTSREVFAEHFPLARSIARVSLESDPPADNTLLKCFMYQYGTGPSYTTPAVNRGLVDTCILNGGVAIASYHELVTGTPATGVTTQYNIADFTENMKYLASQPIAPLTCREAFTRSSV